MLVLEIAGGIVLAVMVLRWIAKPTQEELLAAQARHVLSELHEMDRRDSERQGR